jgi:CRISPR-associated protein Cmr3
MTTFEIKALDTLFFRDARPFSMGEETLAEGIFPPFPSAIYGALRSIYFADHLPALKLANENDDPTGSLEIISFLPSLNGCVAFPIPQDLYADKRQPSSPAFRLQCHSMPKHILSDYPFEYVLKTSETVKAAELGGKGLLNKDNFIQYLEGSGTSLMYEKMSDYLLDEPKIGIGRDFNTRSASDGKLYRVNMRRPIGKKGELTFLVKFSGLTLPSSGLCRIGGETKIVEYKIGGTFPAIPCPVEANDKQFKIYLATPAIFEEGCYPVKYFEQNGLKLMTAAIGRVQYAGGFDFKSTFPKTMRKAVPAGTVYYVEIIDAQKASGVVARLHEGSIYDLALTSDAYRIAYQKQGFGLTYLGKFNIHSNA